MSTRVPASPPGPTAQYDGKWMYWFWDWVRANRAGYAGTGVVYSGDVLGTLNPGTSALTLSTTGVGAGTYGTGATWPRFSVDAKGRITTATAGGTLGTFAGFASLVGAGDLLGTSTTNTFTGALSTTGVAAGTYGGAAGVPRFDISARGRVQNAAVNFPLVGTAPIIITTGTADFGFSHGTSGVAAGTYGGTGVFLTFVINALGHITNVGTAA